MEIIYSHVILYTDVVLQQRTVLSPFDTTWSINSLV